MVFSIEGLIGCGKTTLCNLLAEEGHCVVTEPVEQYASFGLHNPLKSTYLSPISEFPLTQLHIMRSAVEHYTKPVVYSSDRAFPSVIFTERNIYSSSIFIETYSQMGWASSFTKDFLLSELQHLCSGKSSPDAYVFLDLFPEICLKRVHDRENENDKSITPDFQRALYSAHVKFFDNCMLDSVPVVFLTTEESTTPAQVKKRLMIAVQYLIKGKEDLNVETCP